MPNIENLTQIIQMRGTKSNITAFTATLEEGAISFSTDTQELGIYTNGDWEWVTTSGSYSVTAQDIGARVYNDANINVSGSSDTYLTFNQERYDTDAIHSTLTNTGRLTCNTAGKYLIIGLVQWIDNATGQRQVWVRLNGTTDIGRNLIPAVAVPNLIRQQVSTIYELNVGDYVELGVYQNAGTTLSITSVGNRSPEFMMQLISGIMGSSSNSGVLIYDDNTFKTTGTAIHFNDNLSVITSGSLAWINGQAGGGGGTDLLIYDGTTFKVTGTSINFGDNLDVAVTGSTAYISAVGVTGSAGAQGEQGIPGPAGSNTSYYDDSVFKATGTTVSFDRGLDISVTGSSVFVNISSNIYPTFSGAILLKGADQNISSATGTAVTFDGELIDTDGYHNTGTNTTRLTAPVTGYYMVGGSAEINTLLDQKFYILSIQKNGVATDGDGRARVYTSGNSLPSQHFSRPVQLNIGEYVELIVQHNNGNTQPVRNSNNGTSFWIYRIA